MIIKVLHRSSLRRASLQSSLYGSLSIFLIPTGRKNRDFLKPSGANDERPIFYLHLTSLVRGPVDATVKF